MNSAEDNSSPAKCLAVLGTGSNVGKSIVATGLCRVFRDRGLRVAPYKAQNMSNNSHITLDGGEMGRAQVVQAQAAGVEPTVDMNPVLLKPSADMTAQVIVQGRPVGNAEAFDYFRNTDVLFEKAKESLDRLRSRYDLLVMEGAGSCGEVNLHYLARPRSLRGYDLLLLPGCKNVRADIVWLRDTGWAERIRQYVQDGGRIGGVCGGYQMLGRKILDPEGLEGPEGETAGLGLLPVETTLHGEKTLTRTKGTWLGLNQDVDGYEIHMGATQTNDDAIPVLQIAARNNQAVDDTDGAQTADGRIWGTYLHGLFDEPDVRHAFLRRLCPDLADQVDSQTAQAIAEFRDTQYNLLAEHMRKHINIPRLCKIVGLS